MINLIFSKKITSIIKSISSKAKSLIYDVDSNRVSISQLIVAKYVGGKKNNFSLIISYEMVDAWTEFFITNHDQATG